VATAGCRALTPELRCVAWPGKFKPDLPPRYDGTADPAEFLQLYELCIEPANGDERVMANWFPMALKDGARTWLLNLPPGTVSLHLLCRYHLLEIETSLPLSSVDIPSVVAPLVGSRYLNPLRA